MFKTFKNIDKYANGKCYSCNKNSLHREKIFRSEYKCQSCGKKNKDSKLTFLYPVFIVLPILLLDSFLLKIFSVLLIMLLNSQFKRIPFEN